MSEWMTAVVGLAGAGVGAGAAVWGAQRAARASQEALALQVRKEDERWMRDQRQSAYQALLDADRDVHEAIAANLREQGYQQSHSDVRAAIRTSSTAARLIEIPGPQSVVDAAQQLLIAQTSLANFLPLRPENARQWNAAMTRHREVSAAFRQAARRALGYADLDESHVSSTGETS
ncbi:hypothetical protein [Streptomyces phaeoluteigriseus]|uniref:hypothetical protein n=1 Tax=Streptomyces phaeoluteigriseus TaxID=114686 RepID=UPI0036C84B29